MKTALKKRAHEEDVGSPKKKTSKVPSQTEPKPKKQKTSEQKGVTLNPQSSPPSSVMLSDSALKNIDIDVMFNNSEQEPVFPDIQTGLDPLERQIASEILSEM
ncbi:hypothetical protein QZH41_013548 [Actinostola sp. cb2023]|nr:hypothetical protein QZH41_013548 [Actinostola sp. cb2023]